VPIAAGERWFEPGKFLEAISKRAVDILQPDVSHAGGLAEVKLSKLAMEKGQSMQVKQFARKMVEDHNKADTELKQIAEKKGMTLPTQLDDKHQKAYDRLTRLEGPDFDREYMKAMTDDHDDTVKLFKDYKVLTKRELESRYEVFLEQYVTKLNIEAETAASIAKTMLLPAAARHLALLHEAQLADLASECNELIKELDYSIKALEKANLEEEQPHGDVLKHAQYMRDKVIPAMADVREAADKLEKVVADDLWPLPKYSEILFIK